MLGSSKAADVGATSNLNSTIRSCMACKLSDTRQNAVPGDGSVVPDILFVGEAPGENEDRQGLPFIGAAGKELDKMLESIEQVRSQVYITNIVKCRPPANRDPEPEEIAACRMFLSAQVALLQPMLIVTLGRMSMTEVLGVKHLTIGDIHGTVRVSVFGTPCLPLYHPAAMLHNPGLRRVTYTDFAKIPSILNRKDVVTT